MLLTRNQQVFAALVVAVIVVISVQAGYARWNSAAALERARQRLDPVAARLAAEINARSAERARVDFDAR